MDIEESPRLLSHSINGKEKIDKLLFYYEENCASAHVFVTKYFFQYAILSMLYSSTSNSFYVSILHASIIVCY
ncbi:unnamed protein product [Rhizophagus irregularis]|nr:unnamed protein product [Rhizophagus irregularis]